MYSNLLRKFRRVLILVILCLAVVGGLFLVRGPLQSAGAASPVRIPPSHIKVMPVCSGQNGHASKSIFDLIGCGSHQR